MDDVDSATPQARGGVTIDPADLDGKVVEDVTPPGGCKADRLEQLNRARTYADGKVIEIDVKEYP